MFEKMEVQCSSWDEFVEKMNSWQVQDDKPKLHTVLDSHYSTFDGSITVLCLVTKNNL